MMIFDKDMKKEMTEVKDGIEYVYEYVVRGTCFQDIMINYKGDQYEKMSGQHYMDGKTGTMLDSYFRWDENENYTVIVKNLDGSLEIK